MIGRGAETGNHLQLSDRRISRNCAAVVIEANRFYVKIAGSAAACLSTAKRWIAANCRMATRSLSASTTLTNYLPLRKRRGQRFLPQLLTRMEHITVQSRQRRLIKLKRLLEASAFMHSQLPLDEALSHMLDHAVSVTDADRGLLLEKDSGDALKVKLARRNGALRCHQKRDPARLPSNLRSNSNRR